MLHVDNRLLVNEVAKRREKKAEIDAEQRARETAKAKSQQAETTPSDGGQTAPADGHVLSTSSVGWGTQPTASAEATSGGTAAPPTAAGSAAPLPESLIAPQQRDLSECYSYERQLVQLVVRYGERRMFEGATDEEGNELPPLSVIDYITSELQQDELTFHNETHRRILAEAA